MKIGKKTKSTQPNTPKKPAKPGKKTPKKPASLQRRIRKTATDVIMVCLVAIFFFSAYNIYQIYSDYRTNQSVYNTIKKEALPEDRGFTGDINFGSLSEVNPDIRAWLYYEGTQINYPVVQGSDNDKYLHTMFDGTKSSFGTLFIDANTTNPFKQFNTLIYGHHMKNGSMFGDLSDLRKETFAKEHPQLELITRDGGKYHLMICAFLNQPSDSDIYELNISKESDRSDYISMIESHARYLTGEEMTTEDTLVILSTCAYEYKDARYMVVCKMIPWE